MSSLMLYFLRQDLSLNLELTDWLGWLVDELEPPARLHPSTGTVDK